MTVRALEDSVCTLMKRDCNARCTRLFTFGYCVLPPSFSAAVLLLVVNFS